MSLNYHLSHDRVRMEIVPPQRYGCVDLMCYALNVVEGS